MGVTIVANGFSKETIQQLQKEADDLAKNNYSNYAIRHYFVETKHMAVSLNSANGKMIMRCYSVL